ncbi:MAG: AAA family ATPase [Candidatus Paceibacterota bacterium]
MIIGLTGTNGAGKGTVAGYLVREKGFAHYSARDFIVEEIQKRNMPIDRNSMIIVGNALRKEHGPAYVLEQLYLRAHAAGGNAVLESVRTTGEVIELRHYENFSLIGVDAPQSIRYERTVTRKSATDQVSFEEFIALEEREMQSQDPGVQNITAVMKLADYVLINDGSPEELFGKIEEVLKSL